MSVEFKNVGRDLFARCVRAQVESVRKVRIVYYEGSFWRVKLTSTIDRRVVLELISSRRSIDDCAPNEWFEANRPYR